VIPIGTVLKARTAGDPEVAVVGVEPAHNRYMLSPTTFGSTFALDLDEISGSYDTTDHKLFIEPYDEVAEWAKLSREVFHGHVRELQRNARKAADAESPEAFFRRQDAEAAAKRGRK
jgi:hypothetical protein